MSYKTLYGELFYWSSGWRQSAFVGCITVPFTYEYLYSVAVQLRALRTSEERDGAQRQ
jgi:hypothetical protein